jgi:hypothetical protein
MACLGTIKIGTVSNLQNGVFEFGLSLPNSNTISVWQRSNIFQNLTDGVYRWSVRCINDSLIVKTGNSTVEKQICNEKFFKTFYFSDNLELNDNSYIFDIETKSIVFQPSHELYNFVFEKNKVLCAINGVSVRPITNRNIYDFWFDDLILQTNKIELIQAHFLENNNLVSISLFI